MKPKLWKEFNEGKVYYVLDTPEKFNKFLRICDKCNTPYTKNALAQNLPLKVNGNVCYVAYRDVYIAALTNEPALSEVNFRRLAKSKIELHRTIATGVFNSLFSGVLEELDFNTNEPVKKQLISWI